MLDYIYKYRFTICININIYKLCKYTFSFYWLFLQGRLEMAKDIEVNLRLCQIATEYFFHHFGRWKIEGTLWKSDFWMAGPTVPLTLRINFCSMFLEFIICFQARTHTHRQVERPNMCVILPQRLRRSYLLVSRFLRGGGGGRWGKLGRVGKEVLLGWPNISRGRTLLRAFFRFFLLVTSPGVIIVRAMRHSFAARQTFEDQRQSCHHHKLNLFSSFMNGMWF